MVSGGRASGEAPVGPIRVVIEISASHVRLASVRARHVLESRSADLESGVDLRESIREASRFLGQWVRDLGVAGSRATILYHNPNAETAVVSCPRAAGVASAARAAALVLDDRAAHIVANHPHTLTHLAVDAGAKEGAQIHTLGVADSADVVDLVSSLADTVGLVLDGVIPVEVGLCAQAVDRALRHDGVVLAVGGHTSLLAHAQEGRLVLVRSFKVGVETLCDALTTPIRCQGGTVITLSEAEARHLLEAHGIPGPDEKVDARARFDGASILPLLRPTIQRAAAEIKQSLRFRAGAGGEMSLMVTGPGRRIPNLARVIAQEASLTIDDASSESADEDAIAVWVRHARPEALLMPERLATQRATRRVRKALYAGVAATVALIALDAWFTHASLDATHERLESIRAQIELADTGEAVGVELDDAGRGLLHAQRMTKALLSGRSDIASTLAMLAENTPPGIRLTEINFTETGREPVCKISARAEAPGAPRVIRGYLDQLGASPMVTRAQLGATYRVDTEAGAAQDFDFELRLLPLPYAVMSDPAVAIASEEGP